MGKPTEAAPTFAENAHTNDSSSGSRPPLDAAENDHLLDAPGGGNYGGDGDDDVDLPMYSAVAESSALISPEITQHTLPSSSTPLYPSLPDAIPAFHVDYWKNEYYMSEDLDNDPKLLEQHILAWSSKPPRTLIRIRGTHSETRTENGKSETKRVSDFDVSVDMTPYLYTDATRGTSSWAAVCTVENDEKVKRGTSLARRAPGFSKRRRRRSWHGLEDAGELNETKPSLTEWCHRYCASSAGSKVFVLKKRVVGVDEDLLRERLYSLVRSTNYRGAIHISFPTSGDIVYVYNECKINKWRFNQVLMILSFATLLFIPAFIFLFFWTKYFETVVAVWPFSKPTLNGMPEREFASLSEDQLFSLWGAAIHRAVLGRRNCVLNQQDLVDSHTEREGSQHGVHALVASGIRAMNLVDQQFGWGSNV